ncbi:MAG TPA: L-seryl-tRNA(Sec) selenium transferase [Gemmatimonadaceae bacterium]|nr:L-seryl-tRNA(Sec) selenium transferase [Gemmatimonadaceae bacterium]
MADPRRELPSVSALLESEGVRALLALHPRQVVLDAVRTAVDAARRSGGATLSPEEWTDNIATALKSDAVPSLRRVINATGVILHTNLGRAPLAEAALRAIREVSEGFSNLEYEIETGRRGSRHTHCADLLVRLTGAEDALVVNNCAAALVLALSALAKKKEVLVSRGELVEIGGSFRIPDIMATAGVRLVEVGTTNRTHDDDYRRAITPKTGAIVKVHRSNFSIDGFTSDVSVERLAFIAAEHGLPVIHDVGGGLLLPLDEFGLGGEPTATSAVKAGATLVLISGDKLLGGPQAGIILGAAGAVAKLRKNPLARAMRVDKLTLSTLEATLRLYLEPDRARAEIPVLAMLTAPVDAIARRAELLAAELGRAGIAASVITSVSTVGGGAFPTAEIPSRAVAVGQPGDAASLESRLRLGELAVIGRIADDRLLLDLRGVLPRDDAALAAAVLRALS